MSNTALCDVEEQNFCCAHNAFDGLQNMHNSSMPLLLSATRHCFKDEITGNASLHQDQLTKIFQFVLICVNNGTSLPQCSPAPLDARCLEETKTEYMMYMIFLLIVLLSK